MKTDKLDMCELVVYNSVVHEFIYLLEVYITDNVFTFFGLIVHSVCAKFITWYMIFFYLEKNMRGEVGESSVLTSESPE